MKLKCFFLGHNAHEIGREFVEPPENIPVDFDLNKQCKYHFLCLECKGLNTYTINFCKE